MKEISYLLNIFERKINLTKTHMFAILNSLETNLRVVVFFFTKTSELNSCLTNLIIFNSTLLDCLDGFERSKHN
jgi:hypothetical protein